MTGRSESHRAVGRGVVGRHFRPGKRVNRVLAAACRTFLRPTSAPSIVSIVGSPPLDLRRPRILFRGDPFRFGGAGGPLFFQPRRPERLGSDEPLLSDRRTFPSLILSTAAAPNLILFQGRWRQHLVSDSFVFPLLSPYSRAFLSSGISADCLRNPFRAPDLCFLAISTALKSRAMQIFHLGWRQAKAKRNQRRCRQ